MKFPALVAFGLGMSLALPVRAEAPPPAEAATEAKANPGKKGATKKGATKPDPSKKDEAASAATSPEASKDASDATKSVTPVTCPPGAMCEPAVPVPPPAARAPAAAAPAASAPAPAPPDARESSPPAPTLEPGTLTVHVPPPPPGTDPTKPRTVVIQPAVNGRPLQVIVYEDGEAPPVANPDVEPPPFSGPTHEHPRRSHAEWGLALRAIGGLMGSPRVGVENFGVGGIGMSLRHRPLLPVALDLGVDLIGGVDPNGWSRREIPISASTVFYLNPRSIVQVYVLGGVNLNFTEVQSRFIEPNFAGGSYDDYTYLGLQGGGGLEFRMSRALGFHFDGLATIRTRIDSDGHGRFPEYYDARTGLASNSSTVGQLRAGLSLWW
ncbi:MAG: hypothetical protein FJ096_04425 [Deltaproteobacteria bacterium]|nr:hypothetical protein [Deltaproteobacteria bacterium]